MNTSQPTLKPLSAVVCDEIRREKDGKDIIIGAYGGDILVDIFPIVLALSLWISLETSGVGDTKADIRIANSEKKVLAEIKGIVTVEECYQRSSLFSPKVRFQVDKSTELRFQLRIGEGRWKTVVSRNVRLRSSSGP